MIYENMPWSAFKISIFQDFNSVNQLTHGVNRLTESKMTLCEKAPVFRKFLGVNRLTYMVNRLTRNSFQFFGRNHMR